MIENHTRFREATGKVRMVIANAFFQQTDRYFFTYRPPGTKSFTEDLSTNNYTQMDYVAINNIWNKSITNIENRQSTLFNSDHT
jgi:hypothetical protein